MLVRDLLHGRNLALAPMETFTTDYADILADGEISIVVECIGGVNPAKDYILRALQAGKTVVTANKEVLSKHWPDLERAAKETGAGLYFEASVGGGIPIIRALNDSMQATTSPASWASSTAPPTTSSPK